MVECNNISLFFNEKKILSNLSFAVNKGQNVCFSGQSGTGKTTLLKILQGFVQPNSGKVKINGWECTPQNIKKIREQIAWVPQNVNLVVNNGTELLHLMDAERIQPMVEEQLPMLGLESELIRKDFSKISGGQKQRIIIAICLCLNKSIILLDEPTASLDEESINLLIKAIQSLKGKTIVSASHNKTWLNNVDRIIDL